MTKFSQKTYFRVTVDRGRMVIYYILYINSFGKGIGSMKKRMVMLSALVLCGCMPMQIPHRSALSPAARMARFS